MADAPPSPTSGTVLCDAKRIAIITFASRVFGLARDIALAAWLGNSMVQDRFTYGFMIPNLFRRLFGEGALSAAFVPTLSHTLHEEGPEEGKRVYAAVATLLAAVLAGLTLIIEAGLLTALFLGPERESYRLAIGLTAVMLPFMPFICLTALMGSCLNIMGRFSWPAAMPIVMNLIQIACIGAFLWVLPSPPGAQPAQVYVLAVGVVVSGLAQVLILGRMLGRLGYKWSFTWRPGNPAVRQVLLLMAPAMLGMGVLQIEPLLDGQIILWLSSAGEQRTVSLAGHTVNCPLKEGSQSSVAQAQRLYQFPLGVLAISLATAVFPALSRHAAAKNYAALRGEVSRSVRLAIFEGLPAGVGMLLLAEPITALLLQHGNFKPEDTLLTAWVLRFYAAGLWAFCVQQMLTRAFYALHDAKTPLKIAMLCVGGNVALNLILVWTPLRAGTFGLTAALTTAAGVVGMGILLRRKLEGRLAGREILSGVVKTAAAVLVMSALVGSVQIWGRPLWLGAEPAPTGNLGLGIRLLDVAIPMLVGGVGFVATAWVIKSRELKELFGTT